jgi:hypothetical protein
LFKQSLFIIFYNILQFVNNLFHIAFAMYPIWYRYLDSTTASLVMIVAFLKKINCKINWSGIYYYVIHEYKMDVFTLMDNSRKNTRILYLRMRSTLYEAGAVRVK